VTTLDLSWHLSTSNGRLVDQVWPSLLLLLFLMLRPLRPPESKPNPFKKELGRKRHAKAIR
jgi:hypothetical protein